MVEMALRSLVISCVTYFALLWISWFLKFIYLSYREGGEREKEWMNEWHPLVHLPGGHSVSIEPDQSQETEILSHSLTCVAGVQTFGAFSAAFLRLLAWERTPPLYKTFYSDQYTSEK